MSDPLVAYNSHSDDESEYTDFTKYFEAHTNDFSNIKLYDEFENNLIEIYRSITGQRPDCKNSRIKDVDRPKLYSYLKSLRFSIITTLFQSSCYELKDSVILLASADKRFLVAMDEVGVDNNIKFLYCQNDKKHLQLIEKIIKFSIKKPESGKISMLVKSYGDLELRDFNIKNVKLDYDNYNDNFPAAHSKIVNFIESDDSGLILLYSVPGAGKSFYLRSLVNEVKKKVVFISREAISAFSSPDFLGFALDKLRDCVLYIEDADSLLAGDGPRSDSTVNLLSMSDGLTGDLLRPKIIATFNCPLDSIDPACKRRGRLKLKYNFEPLSVERSNKLLKKLGANKTVDKPANLCDLYNHEDNNGEQDIKEKVGF